MVLLDLFKNSVVNGPIAGEKTTYYVEVAIVVLISFLLGYLLRLLLNAKHKREVIALKEQLEQLKVQHSVSDEVIDGKEKLMSADNEKLRRELDKLNAELRLLKKARKDAESKLEEREKMSPIPMASTKVQEKMDTIDDLKKIEGIGPKIEFILNEGGIKSFESLSNSNVAVLKDLLQKAGPAYKVHQPNSWPKQAKLAHEGKWEELAELQEVLIGGK